jgi:hypothetical protein
MNAFRVAALLFVSAFAASFAGETNTLPTVITVDGTTYSNVIWRAFTPVTASISHRTGAATIPLWKLTPELQTRFGYDPQKAALYTQAQRNAEIARQEALRITRAEEAERQRQAAEITATNQATEAAARKAAQEKEIHYGPVTQLRFSYAKNFEQMTNGNYYANLAYTDNTGAEGSIFVEFPPAGLNFINHCVPTGLPNGYSVYGKPYTAQLHHEYFGGDVYGQQYTATAYWLVGVNFVGMNGYLSW